MKLVRVIIILFQCRYHEAFVAYAGCNLILAAASAALCAYVAPAAAGSGIPEVKAYLNGVDAHSILAPSTLFVKVAPLLGFRPIIRYIYSLLSFMDITIVFRH